MVLGDLAAQHETDAAAIGFCGEKRHKQICGLRDSRSVVLDRQLDAAGGLAPAQAHTGVGMAVGALLEGGLDRVLHEVDYELFDLRNIGGRLLLNMAIPAYEKVADSHWKTADLRVALRQRIAEKPAAGTKP